MDDKPQLSEPITVGEWRKNRQGESIRVRLNTYEEHNNLLDIRTWFTGDDGVLKPGKGFAYSIRHLPKLLDVLTKAAAKARELGILGEEERL